MSVTIVPLSPKTQALLSQRLDQSRLLGLDDQDLEGLSNAFDRYLQETVTPGQSPQLEPDQFFLLLATALGTFLQDRSPLEWMVLTDENGSEIGLADPTGEHTLFPADPMVMAWNNKQMDWVSAWVNEILKAFTADDSE